MVKHNNVIPNGHFHKDWQRRIKTWFDQPVGSIHSSTISGEELQHKEPNITPAFVYGQTKSAGHVDTATYSAHQNNGACMAHYSRLSFPLYSVQVAAKKKSRRLRRKAKAAAIAPRPAAGLLRPAVHCPTVKYASKVRAGKGFTLEELKEAGINRKQALSIGIAVDFRRTNKSVESLQANVQRLKAYKAKLVVFPRKNINKPKNGDSAPEETKNSVQHTGPLFPITRSVVKSTTAVITDEMKEESVFKTLRVARADARIFGKQKKRLADKAAAKE